jgi:hypothetical protein
MTPLHFKIAPDPKGPLPSQRVSGNSPLKQESR